MQMELNSKDCGVMDVREGMRHLAWTLWRRPSPTSIQWCKALERHSCKARMCKNASMHLVLQSTNWCCKTLWTHRWLQSYRTVQKCCQSMGAAKHLRRGRCTCCKPLGCTGQQARSFTWLPMASFFFLWRLTPMSVPPKYPDSDSSRTLVEFHPVWVRCWVRFSLAASVHRPIWVGAAFNGPSRHCLHGLLNLDSPGYDGMKPVSSESVLEGEKED